MTIPGRLWRAAARSGRQSVFLASGIVPHLAMLLLVLATTAVAYKALDFNKLRAISTLCVLLAVFPLAVPLLTAAHRGRHRSLLDAPLPPLPARHGGPWPRRVLAWVFSASTWRQAGYHMLVAPLLAALEAGVLAIWAAAFAGATYFGWLYALPYGGGVDAVLGGYLTAAGILALLAAPALGGWAVRTETRVAAALLGPGRAVALQHRVADLTESRAGVVDAADAERRRIERDLHDGAQQRLVSLAVNLGLARATLDLPEDARRVIDEAHAEAKAAIAELSHLVRGLHPAVLEDRGLDAALSGLAARVPVPVTLRVSLGERPPPTIEAVAYFIVSEALANVTKHSGATQADVAVERNGQVLRVDVTDNGAGGADASAGTGLTGLAQRVRSVDGTFAIHSPPGGPTTITAELPCGR